MNSSIKNYSMKKMQLLSVAVALALTSAAAYRTGPAGRS